MVYTYLIKSLKDQKSYYCGITSNLVQRITYHNKGKLKTTSTNKPWEIVYVKEYSCYRETRKHEKWLKKIESVKIY